MSLIFEKTLAGMLPGGFSAEIRTAGGRFQEIFVCRSASNCDDGHRNGGSEGIISYAADETVEVRFTFPAQVHSAVCRPGRDEKIEIDGNTVTVTQFCPRYWVLEVNFAQEKSPHYLCCCFGDFPLEEPAETMQTVTAGIHTQADFATQHTFRFTAGVHEIAEGVLNLKSGDRLFLERGAVLRFGLASENANDIEISGQGILDGSSVIRPAGIDHLADDGGGAFLRFVFGKSIHIHDVMLYNPPFWSIVPGGVENFQLRNVKVVGWVVNNDGIQPRSVTSLTVEHCFFKCCDDSIAIKTRKTLGLVSGHHVYRDLVIWQDAFGSAVEIGHSAQGNLLEDLLFEDIDVIHGNGCTGCSAIDLHIVDHCLVKNIRYKNIRCEGVPFAHDCRFVIPQAVTLWRSDREHGRVEGISIQGYFADHPPKSLILRGCDEKHRITDITLDNIRFEEKKLTTLEDWPHEILFADVPVLK